MFVKSGQPATNNARAEVLHRVGHQSLGEKDVNESWKDMIYLEVLAPMSLVI